MKLSKPIAVMMFSAVSVVVMSDLAPENWSRWTERFLEYNVAEVQSI